MMRERGIIMSAPMVRALLDGRKTQTRRIVKPQPAHWRYLQPMFGFNVHDQKMVGTPGLWREVGPDYPDDASDDRRCPYGAPGDRLWVRESFVFAPMGSGFDVTHFPHGTIAYMADGIGEWFDRAKAAGARRRPSIHMPRWASRILLEITEVRVERLQQISEADAQAEGLKPAPGGWWSGAEGQAAPTPREAYALLWSSLHGPESWNTNPWVWVVVFKRVAA